MTNDSSDLGASAGTRFGESYNNLKPPVLAAGVVLPTAVEAPVYRPPATLPAAARQSLLLAERQRGWELGLPPYIQLTGSQPPMIIAIGGGKGGVGKSLVSANLAVRLAATGRKVLAIDLDVGGANLHTYFGVSAAPYNLADAIVLRRRTLSEVTIPTAAAGVRLVSGGREEAWGGAGSLDESAMRALFQALFQLKESGEADIVILDLGAGSNRHTIDFFTAAHLGMMTVLPEPTSIENAYLFLKTCLFRLLDNIGQKSGMLLAASAVRESLLAEGSTQPRGGYAEKLRSAALIYPDFVGQLHEALAGRVVAVTVNQVRSQKDIDVGKSMELIGERYFGFLTKYCGYLNYDEAAWKSLRNRRLLVMDFPHAILSRRFSELARSVLSNLGL